MQNNLSSNLIIPPVLKVASVIIIIAGLMAAQSIVIPLLLALFISIISAKPIIWLEHKKVPATIAILIVLGGIVLISLGMGALLGKSITNLSSSLPEYEENLRRITGSFTDKLGDYGYTFSSNDFMDKFDSGKVFRFFANALSEFGSIMSDSLLIIFIVVFILLELNSYAIKAKVIKVYKGNSLGSLTKIANSIRQYLWIKTLMSILTGILVTIWLAILGVDYAILWGLITFMLNYIPNIGSIIAAIPAVLFALVQLGFGGALWTMLAFITVNMVVGNMIEPKVTGDGLGLSTLIVFLSLIVWGFIFGTVGMFLSVPLTIMIKIILDENPNTKWIGVLMGTEKEAKEALVDFRKNTTSEII